VNLEGKGSLNLGEGTYELTICEFVKTDISELKMLKEIHDVIVTMETCC